MTDTMNAHDLLAGLNPEQVEVVTHGQGPLVTGAVAGAGKTASLVRRIAYLVREHDVDPSRILAVTFSAKAAKEMNDRLRPLVRSTQARVGTFHSLAWEIVRSEDVDLASWDLDERDRYRQVVKEAISYRGMDWKNADLTVVLQFIGRCKARCALPRSERALEEAKTFCGSRPSAARHPEKLVEAYWRSEDIRRQRRLITFDDMLLEAWRMLSTDSSCRSRWSSRWDYVLQDEAQDENLVQREIASMLAADHRNYMIVGDPAQSIYAFRGSDPSGILGFESTWTARKILMHRNYRCGDAIVNAANGVLAAMPVETHLGAQITACRGVAGVVSATEYGDMDAEADGVVCDIRDGHTDGRAWGDNVVLYRTNAQSRALEDRLLTERIPYLVLGGVNFYERREVKDLLAYLRLSASRGSADDVRRCINAPFRFLGKAFVDGLMDLVQRRGTTAGWTDIVKHYIKNSRDVKQARQRASAEQWCSLIDTSAATIKRGGVESRPAILLQEILDSTQYVTWLQRDEGTESPENNRVSNVRELVRAAERFPTVHELLDYIEQQIDAAKEAKASGGGADRVTLMSIHRSKGLEWPVVYVVGVNEGILPHGRCEDSNEERRLAYVAFTRARDVLRISCVRRASIGSRVVDLDPSSYIEEAGLKLVIDDRVVEAPSADRDADDDRPADMAAFTNEQGFEAEARGPLHDRLERDQGGWPGA